MSTRPAVFFFKPHQKRLRHVRGYVHHNFSALFFFLFFFFFFFFCKRQVGKGRMCGEEKADGVRFRYTCSCTSAAPSSWRCGCASPAGAGGCNVPQWGGAEDFVPWRIDQSSHRRPKKKQVNRIIFMSCTCTCTYYMFQ